MNVFQGVIILTLICVFCKFRYVVSPGLVTFSSNIYAKATYLNCNLNSSIAKNVSCKLKAINWEHSIVNVDVDLVGFVRNVTIHVEAFKYTNQFRPFLINVSFNYCDLFVKSRIKNPYVEATFNVIKKYSNTAHDCPYSGHLYIHGAYVDFEFIHFYIPTGTYKLVFRLYDGWPYIHCGTIIYIFKVAESSNEAKAASKREKRP